MSLRLALALVLLPLAASAQESGIRDLMQARNYAMGGAFRAHGLGSESGLGNPAVMSLYRRYQLELSGAWDVGTKFAFGNLAVVDSATSMLAAGLSYHFVSMGRGEDRRIAHFNTVAMSIPVMESLMIGFSGRHLVMTGSREANAITMDTGLAFRIFEAFVIALSGHNLIDTGHPELTRYYAASAAYLGGPLTAAVDVRGDFGLAPVPTMAYSAGLEYVLGAGIPLRAGYAYDTYTQGHQIGVGFGLFSEGGGVDVGYRHEIGGAEGRMIALTLRMQTQ